MLTRRIALPVAALTALATMPVLIEAAPAGASGAVVSPASRGRNGHNDERKADDPKNNCPTTLWTVPLEIKGLACLLLLPKPEKQGQGGDGGGGGGGLLG